MFDVPDRKEKETTQKNSIPSLALESLYRNTEPLGPTSLFDQSWLCAYFSVLEPHCCNNQSLYLHNKGFL